MHDGRSPFYVACQEGFIEAARLASTMAQTLITRARTTPRRFGFAAIRTTSTRCGCASSTARMSTGPTATARLRCTPLAKMVTSTRRRCASTAAPTSTDRTMMAIHRCTAPALMGASMRRDCSWTEAPRSTGRTKKAQRRSTRRVLIVTSTWRAFASHTAPTSIGRRWRPAPPMGTACLRGSRAFAQSAGRAIFLNRGTSWWFCGNSRRAVGRGGNARSSARSSGSYSGWTCSFNF
mmetsp:Transcript_15057/g.46470  ORF Transcript_15057/g.46470 Transcript_15057/m.46470 type:complete len:236 (+) Transcript_15057:820-1527(+)